MATMSAQQLWPKLATLIYTAMSTNYSFQTLSQDLAEILSKIESQCPNLDHSITGKLKSAQQWAAGNNRELSLANLYDAYRELTKKYIDRVCKDYLDAKNNDSPETNYAIELIGISLKWDALNMEYQDALQYGVDTLGVDTLRERLHEYCEFILSDDQSLQKLADAADVPPEALKVKFLTLKNCFLIIFCFCNFGNLHLQFLSVPFLH